MTIQDRTYGFLFRRELHHLRLISGLWLVSFRQLRRSSAVLRWFCHVRLRCIGKPADTEYAGNQGCKEMRSGEQRVVNGGEWRYVVVPVV